MTNNIFNSEKEFQNWLSKKLIDHNFSELIVNFEEFKENVFDDIIERKIFDTFCHCMQSLKIHEVICEDENISLKKGDILRPDFLLYAPETESIVIVELKNLPGTSREAGTEVSAYAGEIKSYIPFISEGDLINVIISPVWPTLLKHYTLHELFWLQRNIICLEPIIINGEIHLKIIDITSLIDGKLSLKLSEKHLGGYQVCLYDHNKKTNFENKIEQMKSALSFMAAKGNSQKNHGFAFLWKDNWEMSLAPYSITVVNFAPFNSVERLLHDDDFELNSMTENFIKIIQEHSPEGHGYSLDQISDSGERFLKSFCSPTAEGFTTWDTLKNIMLPRATLKSFKAWGIFEELMGEKILKLYEKKGNAVSYDNPQVGLELLEEIIDENYEFYDLAYIDFDS